MTFKITRQVKKPPKHKIEAAAHEASRLAADGARIVMQLLAERQFMDGIVDRLSALAIDAESSLKYSPVMDEIKLARATRLKVE